MVPEERLELSRVAPHDFESCASTSSATPAKANATIDDTIIILYRIQMYSTNASDIVLYLH